MAFKCHGNEAHLLYHLKYLALAFLCQKNSKLAIYVPQVEKYGVPGLGWVVTMNVGFMERLQ